MDQVTSTIPKSVSSPKALHTASEPSTTLFRHGVAAVHGVALVHRDDDDYEVEGKRKDYLCYVAHYCLN